MQRLIETWIILYFVSIVISRMEVQADVQKERCSLSGESATVSLGTISDNASTKAMAGSILNAYMPLERSVVRAYSPYLLQQHISDLFQIKKLPVLVFLVPFARRPVVRLLKEGHCVFLSVFTEMHAFCFSRKWCWRHIKTSFVIRLLELFMELFCPVVKSEYAW